MRTLSQELDLSRFDNSDADYRNSLFDSVIICCIYVHVVHRNYSLSIRKALFVFRVPIESPVIRSDLNDLESCSFMRQFKQRP